MGTLNLNESERRLIAASLLSELLVRDGYTVTGPTSSADGLDYTGNKAMLVPPAEAEGSRWYDPGPKYPKEYVKTADLVEPAVIRALQEWIYARDREGLQYILQYLPHTVEYEKIKGQMVVTKRDDCLAEEGRL